MLDGNYRKLTGMPVSTQHVSAGNRTTSVYVSLDIRNLLYKYESKSPFI